MQLQNKTAVVYGAGGAIGSAIAQAFAREGARVFITGKNSETLKVVAEKIKASGGFAQTAIVDALDEEAVNKHLKMVVEQDGKIDISFNAIGNPQNLVQGTPLSNLSEDSFMLPVTSLIKSNFLTAKAAGNYMAKKNSGIIFMMTATLAAVPVPLVGGLSAAMAGLEALTRTFGAELGPSGVRVVCLRADAMPETETIMEAFGVQASARGIESINDFQKVIESMTMLKRLPKLSELADTAVFLASDGARAITGTTINITCGSVVD